MTTGEIVPGKFSEEKAPSRQYYYKGDLRFPIEITEWLPNSKTAYARFKNGAVYLIRADHAELGPSQEELKDKKRADF